MSERSGSVWWSLYDSDSDSSCAATTFFDQVVADENYQDVPCLSFFFLVASIRCNISGHTWTESLDQIPPGLDYEVQLQAYQQHLLKESLWIRLNAQRRRKSHALDASASVSWVVGIKSSTLLEDSAENNLSRQPVFTLLLGQRPYPSIHLFSSASSSHSGQMSLHWVGWSTRELAKQSCVETVCVCMCVCVCVCMLWFSEWVCPRSDRIRCSRTGQRWSFHSRVESRSYNPADPTEPEPIVASYRTDKHLSTYYNLERERERERKKKG